MFSLHSKVALVTGAARGLGRAIALAMARQGAEVIVNDLNESSESQSLQEEIMGMGRRVLFVQTDVSDAESVDGLFQMIQTHFGRLDILVNNAGISQDKDIFTTTLEDWNTILRINLSSAFLCAKQAMLIMREQRSGRIIQLSSVTGEQGAVNGHIHYATTKSGLLGFTKTLARIAAPYGITVNAIAPGIIQTELLHHIHGEEGIRKLATNIPLGLGSPEDVAAAAVYLASNEARYLTGITLDVNGGLYFR